MSKTVHHDFSGFWAQNFLNRLDIVAEPGDSNAADRADLENRSVSKRIGELPRCQWFRCADEQQAFLGTHEMAVAGIITQAQRLEVFGPEESPSVAIASARPDHDRPVPAH